MSGHMEVNLQINASNAFGRWVIGLLFLAPVVDSAAKDKSAGTIVQGTVFLVDKAGSVIMVDTKSGARRQVVYRDDTKFRYGKDNKGQDSAIDQVQEHQYISCRGAPDRDRFIATECSHREQR